MRHQRIAHFYNSTTNLFKGSILRFDGMIFQFVLTIKIFCKNRKIQLHGIQLNEIEQYFDLFIFTERKNSINLINLIALVSSIFILLIISLIDSSIHEGEHYFRLVFIDVAT